jgi:hypothetical protein
MKNKKNRKLTPKVKFQILYRDNFKCRYCGASTGSGSLEVDHLIPISFSGSDHPDNLATACKDCNRNRADQPLFPKSMVIGTDSDGWDIVKRWGVWCVKACRRGVVVAGSVYGKKDPMIGSGEYWFEVARSHESDWESHIEQKGWEQPHKLEDFLKCLEWSRNVTQK